MLIASLREVIQKQMQEIAGLQQQLKQSTASNGDEVIATFDISFLNSRDIARYFAKPGCDAVITVGGS
jgi:hypothetical protein